MVSFEFPGKEPKRKQDNHAGTRMLRPSGNLFASPLGDFALHAGCFRRVSSFESSTTKNHGVNDTAR